MSFVEGYVVGSALSRGRYRPAAPGTGALLYGGGIATGAGLLAGINGLRACYSWRLASSAMIFGSALQGEGDANHRPRLARYGLCRVLACHVDDHAGHWWLRRSSLAARPGPVAPMTVPDWSR